MTQVDGGRRHRKAIPSPRRARRAAGRDRRSARTLATVPTVLVLGALAVGSLALGAAVVAATGGAGPGREPTQSATATDSARVRSQGANPDWEFLDAIRTSGMDFTGDWEADLQAAGVDLGRVETFQLRARVCGSAMDDGTGGYHPASQTHGLWLSSFHDEVRRMGRDHGWDAPRTVAYHHCPARFGAVGAVQDLENRAKNP